MSKRNRLTLADYAVVALCPSLIVLLLSSLVYFVVLCAYHGEYSSRLGYIWFMFILGAVGIARISIEQSRGYAVGYAAVLGLATFVVLSRFQVLGGPAAALTPLINAMLIATVWFLADRITFDCTLIDDDQDASGQGLLDGLSSRNGEPSGDEALAAAAGTNRKRRRTRQPGRTVLWLTAAALPLFGIGQFVLRADPRLQRAAMFALAIYLFATLSLLVATSFLGVRRYLRQRGVDMPPSVSAAWLGGGVIMTAVILMLCFALPQPGRMLANLELPAALQSPDWLSANRHGWGSEGAGAGDHPDAAGGATSRPAGAEETSAAAPGQTDPASGETQPGGQQQGGEQRAGEQPGGEQSGGQQQGGEQGGGERAGQGEQGGQAGGGQQSGGEQSGGEPSGTQQQGSQQSRSEQQGGEQQGAQQSRDQQSDAQDSGEQQSASEQSGDQQSSGDPSAEAQPGDAPQRESASEPAEQSAAENAQQQSADARDPNARDADAREPSQPAAQSSPPPPPSAPSPLSQLLPSLSWLLKAIIYIVLLSILAVFLWMNRAALAEFWQRLMAWLSGSTPVATSNAETAVDEIAVSPPRPFASFANPLGTGIDPRRAVVETFQATEAWYRERGQPRRVDETPQEYASRLKTPAARDRQTLARLIQAYNRIVYGGGSASPQDLQTVKEVWQSFATERPRS